VDAKREEIVEMLLMFGADINRTDAKGETALCRAVVTNQSSMVELLLKRGAYRFIVGNRGINAIDIAKDRKNNEKIIALLENYTDKEAEEERKNIKLMKIYTEKQAEEDEKMQRSLISRQFINEQDKRGETALMAAVRKNDIGAVEVLLNFDADLGILNNKGKSALDIAENKKNAQLQIVKMLRDKIQGKGSEK